MPTTIFYTASGGLGFGGKAPVASNHWSYVASGGLNSGGSSNSTCKWSYVASGGLKTKVGTPARLTYKYVASGGLGTKGSAVPVSLSVDVITTFTWDISEGVLRNWRVLGKCLPANHSCPSTNVQDNGCPPNRGNTMQFMMNVQAHSITDLCKRLKDRGWIAPINKIQVWSQPVRKSDWSSSVDPTCNTLTTVDFSNVPNCFNYLVDQDLSVTGAFTSTLIFETSFSYVASGGLGTRPSSKVVSNHYSYVASGGLGTKGSSVATSPQYYHYIASGGLGRGGGSTYHTSDYGICTSYAGASATVLDLGVMFGVQSAPVLTASTIQVAGSCCPVQTLPQILFVKHDLNRSNELSNFLMVNKLTLPPILTLMYNQHRNSWYSNTQFRGMSIDDQSDQQIWNIVFEFGCLAESGLLDVPSNVWGFSILLRRKSIANSRVEITRLVLEFDPAKICTITGSMKFDFTFNTKLETTNPVAVRTAVFLDELNSFNGTSYSASPNASFEVSASLPDLGAGMFDQSAPLKNILLSLT